MHHRAVNLRILSAAFFVVEGAIVSNACQNQTVANPLRSRLISGKPRDRANRSWDEQEPVGITKFAACEKLCQVRGDRKARQIVVCQRRMTHMTRNQDLVGRASRKIAFSQSQASVHESRINTNFILAVFERLQLIVSNTKTPIFFVVGRAIWNPVGLLRNTEEVRPEFLQRHSCVHGNAVIHNVQIAFLKVDDAFSVGGLDECIADVPFPWHVPVEGLRARRHFRNLDWNPVLDHR